ncbi:hypothetical protein ARMSODRAFT_972743 [Armillaria solidipes]|uniref:Uncharacterized protein n=1 Tax=Armillaria solidipes TaxID=1076256 RepID=A0A2H3BR03_9AGAR|nr:hypothetical protein ARMSODRAFT_972743 [Armillaria solidipes]
MPSSRERLFVSSWSSARIKSGKASTALQLVGNEPSRFCHQTAVIALAAISSVAVKEYYSDGQPGTCDDTAYAFFTDTLNINSVLTQERQREASALLHHIAWVEVRHVRFEQELNEDDSHILQNLSLFITSIIRLVGKLRFTSLGG